MTIEHSGAPNRGRIPAGTTLAAGPSGRERLGRLLGLGALARRGFRVTAAAWVAEHVELELERPDGGVEVLVIERAEHGRPGLVRCDKVTLGYLGHALDPLVEAALRKVVPRTLGRAALEDLARLISSDPEAGQAGAPLPQRPAADQQRFEQGALLMSWGAPSVRTQFFATAEIARAQLDSLDTFNDSVFVQHSDFECVFLTPQTGVPMVPLVLYPWDDRLRQIDWRRPGRRRPPETTTARLVTTDLDEGDVILGRGPAKLNAALDHIERGGGAGAEMVFCASTCVPVVAGEDLGAPISRRAGRLAQPLFHLTTTPHSMQSLLRPLLVDRRRAVERAAAEPAPPRSINLIGFAQDPALEELMELLSTLELEVVTAVIPALAPSLIDQLPRASLDVLAPNELWQAHYDQLRLDSPRPAISPPGPWGWAGTRRWLTAVAVATGVGAEVVDEALAGPLKRLERRWEGLRARAGRHRLGFVVAQQELEGLCRPAKTFGIPLVALVQEAGFEATVLIDESERDRPSQPGLSRQLEAAGAEVMGFDGAAELGDLLARPGWLSALYSEHFFDRRLSSRGLSAFSGQHFEPGLAGALRGAERLVELCELPFYRRYQRHLAGSATPGA